MLHPVILLLLQLFLITGDDPSHSLYTFQGLGDVGATFDLCRCVADDGFGDHEDVGEVSRHVDDVDDNKDA